MKKAICIAMAILPLAVQAGVHGPTSHSRANCLGCAKSEFDKKTINSVVEVAKAIDSSNS
jgi:hypothetical protein